MNTDTEQQSHARIDTEKARIASVLQTLDHSAIDYSALIAHLRSLPHQEAAGLIWSNAILDYFGIGSFLEDAELAFSDAAMQIIVDLGVFTQVHSKAIEQKVFVEFGSYDLPRSDLSFVSFGWYRRNEEVLVATK